MPQMSADGGAKKKAPEKKRKKVSKACIFCKRSHMYCNETRPCERCIKREIGHLCRDDPPPASATRNESLPPHALPPTSTPQTRTFPLQTPHPRAGPGTVNPASTIGSASGTSTNNVGASGSGNVNGEGFQNGIFGSAAPFLSPSTVTTNVTSNPTEFPLLSLSATSPTLTSSISPMLSGMSIGSMSNGMQGLGGFGSGLNGGGLGLVDGSWGPGGEEFFGVGLNDFIRSLDDAPAEGSLPINSMLDGFLAPLPMSNQATPVASTPAAPGERKAEGGEVSAGHNQQAGQRPRASSDGSVEALPANQTERYLLAAADQKDGSRDERLARVIRAKFEAGLLKPYNHVAGYTRLMRWIDSYMSPAGRQRTLQTLSEFRPAFRAVAASLTDLDLVFIEEAFERMMLDYDRVFSAMGIPACLWRRTGEIYKGNKEFAELIGVPIDKLREGNLAIYELMAEESAVNYWEKYGNIAFNANQKAVLTTCVLVNQSIQNQTQGRKRKREQMKEIVPEALINCCFSFTVRRDNYQIPSMIVGNFAPIIG